MPFLHRTSAALRLCVSLLLLDFCTAGAAPSAFKMPVPLEIGSPAPAFTLPGVDGKNHSLADYAGAEVLAVLFTCNHCPTAQAAEARVIRLVKDFENDSFQLLAISPNDPQSVRVNELGYALHGDSLEEMKLHAAERGFNFPYLYDGETQDASRAYGALATPHIFVFDRERILRYAGRVDDSRYAEPSTVKSHEARDAIEALLASHPVPVATTKVHGCSIKWAGKRDLVAQFEEEFMKAPVTVEPIDAAGVRSLMKNDTGKLRMVNCWATWCGPCMEEFPALVRAARQFETRGFDFISIATNAPTDSAAVLEFLKDEHAALPRQTARSVEKEGRKTNNYHFTGDPADLIEALDPEWAGPIPYTVLVAPGGKVVWRSLGEVEPAELKKAILDQLGRFYTP